MRGKTEEGTDRHRPCEGDVIEREEADRLAGEEARVGEAELLCY